MMDWIVELLWDPKAIIWYAMGILATVLHYEVPRWLQAQRRRSEPREKKGGRTMNDVLKALHPDELAALPRIIKQLKQQDGESWAIGDLLERLLKELPEGKG